MKRFLNRNYLLGVGIAAVLIAGVALVDSLDLFSGDTSAEAEPKGKIVSVTGEGAITVKPDIGYLSVGVDTSDKDAKKAQEMNKAAMDNLIKALKAKGITDKDIKTTNYTVWKGVDYSKVPAEQVEAYHVNNMVEVTITKLDQAGAIMDECVAQGANISNGVRFTVKDKDAFYQQALKAAMEQANTKATGIMDTFGAKPGKPWRVTEIPMYDGPIAYGGAAMDAKAMSASPATPIMAGEMEIKAQVTVEYDY